MSPVRRGRKRTATGSGRPDLRILEPLASGPEECDCPACTGADLTPEAFVKDLAADAADLLAVDDPLDAELFGANLVAVNDLVDDFIGALAEDIVPALARMSTPASLGVLLAIGAVEPRVRSVDAARQLLADGVPAPAWASELSEPVTVGMCRRYADPAGGASMLLCSFERSGRTHAFLVHVDHLDCDAAADVTLFPGEVLDRLTTMIEADSRRIGAPLVAEDLNPDEFRRQAERALDARAVHDQETGPDLDDLDDPDGPGYHPVAALLRARLAVLPRPTRPSDPHGAHDPGPVRPRRTSSPRMPAKRRKSDGPPRIYQIKVSLRDAEPPIWRRLEVPGDTNLAELHRIIQVAFGWDDCHLHVFETPYGAFGVADRELGHRAEKPVTLEQVAPDAGAQVRYRYDFGDDWELDIVVEKLLDRQAVGYPRCTAGRRAAPPEDCGGIWGYADLVDIISDPAHPQHRERLEWLGLPSADDFRPARFDPAEVTGLLTGQGRRG
ncbi:plasmid pRiA4b ORF-3 family protein [Jidongwangia harbinensis]|uniref:plasmid pRiA4b ORF-3 family protein n=1 Tax=Jidongwangia harbinensis TaxID=2878561 RepID=UPI001CD9F798|nr:plasmid pRiA4b ORF-3 family protein [Jidongwangia harbinensis]MCA2216978.1 plasmid pRiA4b ORF-3 family protein [Jidongwangia harbinensis]